MFACSGNHDAGGRGLHWVADAFDTPFALWSGKLIDFLQWWWCGRAESIRRKVYPTVYAGVSNNGVIRCHFPPLRRWLWCLLQGKDLLGENFIWLVGWATTVSSMSCTSWRRRLENPLTRHSLANAEPVLWKKISILSPTRRQVSQQMKYEVDQRCIKIMQDRRLGLEFSCVFELLIVED